MTGRDRDPDYFLGSIVAVKNGTFEVVDGQQRLATVTILIAAIRDYLLKTSPTDEIEDIERTYLLSRDRRSRETFPNLTLNETDHEFFNRRVLVRPDHPTRDRQPERRIAIESHKRIARAASLAADHVSTITRT